MLVVSLFSKVLVRGKSQRVLALTNTTPNIV